MFTLSFGGSDGTTIEYIQEIKPRLILELVKTIDGQSTAMQARIVSQKLQGQVLHHRSGKLGASIRVIRATVDGDIISGGVEGAGGPAWYGVVQEKGGTRSYEIRPVNKQALAFIPTGAGLSLGAHRTLTRNLRVGKPGAVNAFADAGGVVVKKVIHPPLPARPYMSTTLEEMRGQIYAAIEATATRTLES